MTASSHRRSQVQRRKTSQLPLFVEAGPVGAVDNLHDRFRALYYHLYSNSRTSRAERLIEDLSLLLLLKLTTETNGGDASVLAYLNGATDANSELLPRLREAYPDQIDAHARFSISNESIRETLSILGPIRLTDAPAHVLGEAFQALMGPRLRGDKGQFFTPVSLVRAMVRITDPQPAECVLDPACGTGGFLAEAYAHQKTKAQDGFSGRLVGLDKDHGLSRLAGALLAVSTRGRAHIHEGDSLDESCWNSVAGPKLYDVVLTNPPFGSKIAVRDKTILSAYELAHRWREADKAGSWSRTEVLQESQDPQILFLELCVRRLRAGGRLGIVLPEGLFGNRQSGYVWDWLRSYGDIVGLLDCPRTTFQPSTDTKTNVLFFRRASTSQRKRSNGTQVAVALNCGHDRRGRTHGPDGSPFPDDFGPLAEDFIRKDGSRWKNISLGRTYYMVPRYHARDVSPGDDERAIIAGAPVRTLRELVADGLLTVRKGHEVGAHAYGTGPVPFVRTSDISNFEIRTDPTTSISEECFQEYADQQRLQAGDVLLVVDGRYRIGAPAMLTAGNTKCVVQSHLRILGTPNRESLDPYELLFALSMSHVRLRIRNLVFIQSTLGTVGKRLLELEIPLLHGAGPWKPRVEAFRSALVSRDASLQKLQSLAGTEYEL